MKNKVILKASSVLAVSLFVGPVLASSVGAASTGGAYNSNGSVNFLEGANSGKPVDPLDPTIPVGPVGPDGTDPAPGTGGALSIDFASSLAFGQHKISANNETYYAHAQWINKDKNGAAVDITRPNYVQVTDTRGTWGGWTLTVAQQSQFTNAAGEELKGAELSFSGGYAKGTTAATPSLVNNATFSIGTAATKIMGAKTNEGMGTWVYGLGTNNDYHEKGGVHLGKDDVSTASPITLKVNAGTNKATAYTTQLNWSLTDTPAN